MDRNLQPSRRAVLTTAAASAFVAATAPAASAAGATPVSSPSRHPAATPPPTVALPAGIRPEGITSGPGLTFYVGSLADGRIVTGSLRTATVRTLWPGATGRSVRGLYWDRRSGLVWAAGSVDTVGHVWAVDGRTGAVVSDTVVAGAAFLNDLVVGPKRVWLTDSRVDRLTVIPLGRRGAPGGAPPEFLALGGAWPAGDGAAINANGIRQLPDGSLVLNNSRAGGLWQVDFRTGRAAAIPVHGGPGITSGDGLERDGRVLYNVRGTGTYAVSVLVLSRMAGRWSAKWDGQLTASSLDVPSTATVAGRWLWAVNARFGVASPETASYWITRLPARRRPRDDRDGDDRDKDDRVGRP